MKTKYNSTNIIAIDPGNELSAYCLIDCNNKPYEFAKVSNDELMLRIKALSDKVVPVAVIEMVACYGMAVGKEVFETCVWIGRFSEVLKSLGIKVNYVYRKDVKMNLCGQTKAKDQNVRQALIDRFGVVGTKWNQGFFYGFKADIWQAFAVGITWIDESEKGE